MGHFKVTKFEGEAEILGHLKEVGFADGVLRITDLTISQARLIIEHVSIGLRNDGDNMNQQMVHAPLDHVAVVDKTEDPKKDGADTKAAVEASKPKIDALVEEGRKQAAAEQEAEAATEATTEAKPQSAAVKPAKGKGKKAAAKTKPAKEPAAAKEPVAAEEPATEDESNVVDIAVKRGTGDGIAEKVAKFTKLVDVIQALQQEGLTDDDDLIAECERIKDQVPALKRISDITGRVKRVLERLSA